ncbi:hypothetical protein DOY81_014789, partial [Sarcophaga bullata]
MAPNTLLPRESGEIHNRDAKYVKTDYTKYKVLGQTGYFALCAAINRAMKEGLDITNAEYYSKIDMDTVKHIFRSDDGVTMVPLLEERLKCLHE